MRLTSEVRFHVRTTGRKPGSTASRRRWLALAPIVLIPLVTLLATISQGSVYEASADVLINRQEAATTTLIGETPALDDPNRTMETQTLLARTRPVVEGTIEAAAVPGWSVARLRNSSSIFSEADILHFIVSADEPARAARLAS